MIKFYHLLRKIGFITFSKEEIDNYYASKKITKKYGKQYKDIMRKKTVTAKAQK